MANENHVELVKQGAAAIKAFRSEQKAPDSFIFNLEGAILVDAVLPESDLSHAEMRSIKLMRANLRMANLSHAKLSNADLRDSVLHRAQLLNASLNNANLAGVDLTAANAVGAQLAQANLSKSDLRRADLSHANLDNADLRGADLSDAVVDSETSLLGAKVKSCRIDRHTLESLTKYGGLTPGDRMHMDIVDGVATLRASFSGFWQWIHLAALAAFLFPYAWFLGSNWSLAHFGADENEPTITLFAALMRFIWNGGENWREGAAFNLWPFTMFVLSLAYNALRFRLLWKTKMLELKQESSGLPVIFSLTGWWGRAYQAAKWGMLANLFIVAWHTYHFLGQRIPLGG